MTKTLTRSLKLADIRIDAGTQSRATIDHETTVPEYAEAMLDGAKFPPVVVFTDGNENWLADGFHRYWAATKAEFVDLLAEVRPGTLLDAVEHSIGANRSHGLRRTNADKRKAVLMALESFPERSNRALAKMAGVGHDMVAIARKSQLAETASSKSQLGETPSSKSDKRVGLDGKSRSMPKAKRAGQLATVASCGPEPDAVPGKPMQLEAVRNPLGFSELANLVNGMVKDEVGLVADMLAGNWPFEVEAIENAASTLESCARHLRHLAKVGLAGWQAAERHGRAGTLP
jgi:hypothetical protein